MPELSRKRRSKEPPPSALPVAGCPCCRGAAPYYPDLPFEAVRLACPVCNPTPPAARSVFRPAHVSFERWYGPDADRLKIPAGAKLPPLPAGMRRPAAGAEEGGGVGDVTETEDSNPTAPPGREDDVYRCQVCDGVSRPGATALRYSVYKPGSRDIAREILVCEACRDELVPARGPGASLDDLARRKRAETAQRREAGRNGRAAGGRQHQPAAPAPAEEPEVPAAPYVPAAVAVFGRPAVRTGLGGVQPAAPPRPAANGDRGKGRRGG